MKAGLRHEPALQQRKPRALLHMLNVPTHLCEAAQQQPLIVQQPHEVVGGRRCKVAGEQLLNNQRGKQ